ncbi:hypothetical protein V757_01105 [Pelistega indica]|uniref:DUF3277 family protein n=1 Tax=Pelistega indica TaxID=1414851 RepID=V8GA49_9BURK|nr:phage protein [Pelistega indica]ETD72971.1 hypothetical protein V757_01105 [Pelistega indica]
MKIFDPKEVLVLLNGREISDWGDGGDQIKVVNNSPNGQMVIGNNGKGVFVANPDESGTLTLKLKQHSADNKYLSRLHQQQKRSIKTFVPFTLTVKDLINEDLVVATKGYFTTAKEMTRGNAHNPHTWEIVFEQMTITHEEGVNP